MSFLKLFLIKCFLAILFGFLFGHNYMVIYHVFTGLIVLIFGLKKLRSFRNAFNRPNSVRNEERIEQAKQELNIASDEKLNDKFLEFTDSETNFVNKIFTDCWPQVVQFVNRYIKYDYEHFLRMTVPGLSSLIIHRVDLGKKVLKVTGLALDWTTDRRRLSIDANFE
ncbi:hypothetical protein XENTR_v10004444 [Xenopus tropicalis]|nr:hypothetical protein XENTR_v10004444 [Xenopus tropicalis]